MEWTDEITLNLIDIYRLRTVLWDTKNPKYYNKNTKNDAWEEIGKELNTTGDECKKKINSLMSSFRREKAKIRKSVGTGMAQSDVYQPNWFAYESLNFLSEKNKVRPTQNTIQNELEDNVEEGNSDVLLNTSYESEVIEKENNPPQMAPNKKRKKRADDEMLDEAFKILTKASSANVQEINESQIFGNLVAKKLNKYSSELQTSVQQDIMNILFEADRKHSNAISSRNNHPQLYYGQSPQYHSYYNQNHYMPQNSPTIHQAVYPSSPLSSQTCTNSSMTNFSSSTHSLDSQ